MYPLIVGTSKKSMAVKAWIKNGQLGFVIGPRVASVSRKKKNGKRQRQQIRHDGFYAHMVEFGTRHSRARPFMRPALDAKGQAAVNAVQETLRIKVDQLVRESQSRVL